MKVVAYSPIVELSGAPLVFLEVLEILKKNKCLDISFIYWKITDESRSYIEQKKIVTGSDVLPASRSFLRNLIHIVGIRPNLILVNTSRSSILMLLSKLLGIKCICVVHETDEMLSCKNWVRELRYFALRSCSSFISVSKTSAEWLLKKVTVRGPIRIIPNGCDLESFKTQLVEELPEEFFTWLNQNERVVAFCGLLDKRKGIEDLEELCKSMLRVGINVLIIGDFRDDTYSQSVKVIVSNYSNVYITGLTKFPLAYMQHCEKLVFLSRAESYPRVIQEAMWLGLKVISYDVGDVKLMVKDSDHLIVEQGDIQSITAALTEKYEKRITWIAVSIESVAAEYFDVISNS